jgi:hypothetical protein
MGVLDEGTRAVSLLRLSTAFRTALAELIAYCQMLFAKLLIAG